MRPASKRTASATPTPRPAVAPGERAAEPVDELGLEEVELGLVCVVLVVVTEDCGELPTVPTVVIVIVDVPTTAVIVDVPIIAVL
jgi:hypothetical protein